MGSGTHAPTGTVSIDLGPDGTPKSPDATGRVPYGPLVRRGGSGSGTVVFVGPAAPSLGVRCAALPFKLLRFEPRGANDLLLLEDLRPRVPHRLAVARLILVVLGGTCGLAAAALFDSSGVALAILPLLVLALLMTVGAGVPGLLAARAIRAVVDPGSKFLDGCVAYEEALHRGEADRAAAIQRELWDAAGRHASAST